MGFCRGDKIIPQVADGPGLITRFDLVNVSSSKTINKMRLVFYHNDGSKWTVQTNKGTVNEIQLINFLPRQTMRVETSGNGSSTVAGYAVIYDEETDNSFYSADYVLGISVYYVLSTSTGLADTVTISVPEPTALASMPMEMNTSQGISSGIAIVNWAGADNLISVTLYSENSSQYGSTKSFTLSSGQKWSGYLDNNDSTVSLFPELKTTAFKGMAEITATGPIALITLLENRGWDGVARYSTLAPVDKEALRRNTHMVLLQASDDSNPYMPIDLDGFAVDYNRTVGSNYTDSYPWDLEYQYNASDSTVRYLQPFNGAAISTIGNKNADDFDSISLPDLKKLSYTTTVPIDLSNARTSSLYIGFAFAVHTDIGNYAKARIVRIIDTVDGTHTNNKDLILEVCIYK